MDREIIPILASIFLGTTGFLYVIGVLKTEHVTKFPGFRLEWSKDVEFMYVGVEKGVCRSVEEDGTITSSLAGTIVLSDTEEQ